jgi:hypothetical protein
MKTLIKVDELELLQSINQLLIVQSGYCQISCRVSLWQHFIAKSG